MLCNISLNEQDLEGEEIASEFQQSLQIISNRFFIFTCFCDVKPQKLRNFPELLASAMAQWGSEILCVRIEDPISSLSESPNSMGTETTTRKKLYTHTKHCMLPIFPEKSRRLLQEYVNLCCRPVPSEDQVSCGPAGCFVCARAMENQVGCCDRSCHCPENRQDVWCDVHCWVWEASPAGLCPATCYPPSQSWLEVETFHVVYHLSPSNAFPIPIEAPSLLSLL